MIVLTKENVVTFGEVEIPGESLFGILKKYTMSISCTVNDEYKEYHVIETNEDGTATVIDTDTGEIDILEYHYQ